MLDSIQRFWLLNHALKDRFPLQVIRFIIDLTRIKWFNKTRAFKTEFCGIGSIPNSKYFLIWRFTGLVCIINGVTGRASASFILDFHPKHFLQAQSRVEQRGPVQGLYLYTSSDPYTLSDIYVQHKVIWDPLKPHQVKLRRIRCVSPNIVNDPNQCGSNTAIKQGLTVNMRRGLFPKNTIVEFHPVT